LQRWLVLYFFLSGCELFYNLDPMAFPAGSKYETVDRYLKFKRILALAGIRFFVPSLTLIVTSNLRFSLVVP